MTVHDDASAGDELDGRAMSIRLCQYRTEVRVVSDLSRPDCRRRDTRVSKSAPAA